ncbi:uncharacterized protein [Miscanthus floridulus]|uniref:uncharacterized protein n=1 Tax=Miscanthus floridulus TaxID=154761 RepID=UPI003457CE23
MSLTGKWTITRILQIRKFKKVACQRVRKKNSRKKGRPGAVVRAVSLSHQVVGSKQPLRRFFGGKACLGLSLPQTPLMWEPPAKEARKKAIDDMDPKMKEAFENIKFYKFYPVKTPDTPDVNNVKARYINRYYRNAHYLM